MTSKSLFAKNVSTDDQGRVILSDADLLAIEQAFVPSSGSGTNPTTCTGTNGTCTNTGNCKDSNNTISCSNTRCQAN